MELARRATVAVQRAHGVETTAIDALYADVVWIAERARIDGQEITLASIDGGTVSFTRGELLSITEQPPEPWPW